jgi:hypothetical protein
MLVKPRNSMHLIRDKRSERGIAFVELALFLPLVVTIVLALGYLYSYIRTYQVVKNAALAAVSFGSSGEIISQSSPGTSFLQWTNSTPYRPVPVLRSEQCRNLTSSEDLLTCMTAEQTNNRLVAQVWSDWASGASDPISDGFPLPFKLYEPSSTTAGYFHTQVLPIIGIERGCFEPYNETAATIIGTGRHYSTGVGADNCVHAKPMYWQSPVIADFDGDRREDIVIFRPQGQSTTWGARVAPGEVDFVVRYSGAGYSAHAGHGYFNLATQPASATAGVTPAEIPIVADYDRDGLADYGVFDPRTGNYRIAFSMSNYRVIGSGSMGISDPTGASGLVAIPGHYTSNSRLQLAVVRTGGASASGRFDIFLSGLINPRPSDFAGTGTSYSLPAGHNISGAEVAAEQIFKVKPAPGTVSVPAFADYDDDGITELGWLSWYGGNLAYQVAGSVLGPRASSLANFLESDSEPATTPMNTRMNPFDIDFDSSGNLFYSDPVDGRIWRIDNNSLDGVATSDTSSMHMIMPDASTQVARTMIPNPEAKFGAANIWHLTRDNRPLTSGHNDAELPAAERQLRLPRKFFIAKDYDGAMYVADYWNQRIVLVEDSGTGITSASNSRIVLGSADCVGGGCAALVDDAAPKLYSTWDDTSGQYEIYPTALALVPDLYQADRYFLAFSTGNAVYLITHGNRSGGPKGGAGEQIWKIAGSLSTAPSPPDGSTSYAAALIPSEARNSLLCPIIDLKYHASLGAGGTLLMAASCSLPRYPGEQPVLDSTSTGGIYSLSPAENSDGIFRFHDPLGEGLDNSIQISVGSMYGAPCIVGDCATAAANGAGNYQRKLNIMDSATHADIINPVDMEIGPMGEVYFIDQWNVGASVDPDYFPNPPHYRDRIHRQGVWVWEAATHPTSISTFTNPFFFLDGLLPVQGADWYSPSRLGAAASSVEEILAHKAPLKNIPVPAAAGLALFGDKLFTTTPFVRSESEYNSIHPLYTTPKEVGMIFAITMDRDGDGIPDSSDEDIDGDGLPNFDEDATRSPLCPEIHGTANSGACRAQDKIGIPRLSFFKLNLAPLDLNGSSGDIESGAPTGRDYGEFLLINSVAECGPTSSCSLTDAGLTAANVRPEVWATLFNWGDDIDYGGSDACSSANAASTSSPYYNCYSSSNGPIAVPQALHTLVGWSNSIDSYSFNSYPGAGYTSDTTPGAARRPDSKLFKFPFILSSLTPKENGIKGPKRVPIDQTKTPGIKKSGLLCRDYQAEIYLAEAPAAATRAPFKLNFDNYIGNYFYSGFDLDTDSSLDNDSANYLVDCNYDQNAAYPGTDARKAAIEAVVLQVDHDDTDSKESATDAEVSYWPDRWATGLPSNPENLRQFMFIDHDGNGVRDPTFLLPPVASEKNAFETDPMENPYILTGMGLQNSSNSLDPRTINYIDMYRSPMNNMGVLSLFSIASGSLATMTAPYFRVDRTLESSRNLSFDVGRAESSYQRDNTLFLALDFEPYIAKDFELGSRQDIGAGLYTNYSRSTRFRGSASSAPTPIIAARNVLKLSFGLDDDAFVDDEEDLVPGKAFVGFLKNGVACSGALTSTTRLTCDSVKVSYYSKYIGRDIVVSSVVPLNLGFLQNYEEECDPNGAPSGFGCS